jgi:hypothetical protein
MKKEKEKVIVELVELSQDKIIENALICRLHKEKNTA